MEAFHFINQSSELLGGVPIPGSLIVVRVATVLLVVKALNVAVLKLGKFQIIFFCFTYSLRPFIGSFLLLFRHFCILLPTICGLSASNVGKGQEELVKRREGKVDEPKEHLQIASRDNACIAAASASLKLFRK